MNTTPACSCNRLPSVTDRDGGKQTTSVPPCEVDAMPSVGEGILFLRLYGRCHAFYAKACCKANKAGLGGLGGGRREGIYPGHCAQSTAPCRLLCSTACCCSLPQSALGQRRHQLLDSALLHARGCQLAARVAKLHRLEGASAAPHCGGTLP